MKEHVSKHFQCVSNFSSQVDLKPNIEIKKQRNKLLHARLHLPRNSAAQSSAAWASPQRHPVALAHQHVPGSDLFAINFHDAPFSFKLEDATKAVHALQEGLEAKSLGEWWPTYTRWR